MKGTIQRKKRRKPYTPFVWIGLALMLLYYAVLFVYPLGVALLRSFYDWNPLQGTMRFVALQNYRDLFANPIFALSVRNTVMFTVLAVAGRVALSLLIALGLVSVSLGRDFLRSMYFLPVIMPIVAVAIIWTWVYHPRSGLLNMLLDSFGIGRQLFLKSPEQALFSVIGMVIWKDVGYSVIIFTAGLMGVPKDQKEAAQIDGANRHQVFRAVVFPAISPTFTFVLITAMIGYFQSFVEIFILTGGGPGTSTYVISYLIFHQAFKLYNFGYASAISVILFTLITLVTLVQLKWLKKGNEE